MQVDGHQGKGFHKGYRRQCERFHNLLLNPKEEKEIRNDLSPYVPRKIAFHAYAQGSDHLHSLLIVYDTTS